jgi:hybrid cluster-associated redox disulfide protein
MHCLGCPSSSGESIEDACSIHGIDANKLVSELNEFLDKK